MTLTIGILIVGSLYWSPARHRQQWRGKHLRMASETSVAVPIRYGRLSRTGTYTMVFAPGSPSGVGKVCESVGAISTAADVMNEAKALWLAETPDGSITQQGHEFGANWGGVGLLPNPRTSLPAKLLDDWAQHVAEPLSHAQRASYDPSSDTVKLAPAVNSQGILQIPWPTLPDGRLLENPDLLLAVATRPTLNPETGDYPSVQEIANAWNARGDASYFYCNRQNGFRTFQDEEIAPLLRV